MALANYSELATEVGLWLDRDDLTLRIPSFVKLAEARWNRELRTPEMEARVSLTITSPSTALPADFRQMRSLRIDNVPLSFVNAADFFRLNVSGPVNPIYYTIADEQIFFAPAPSSGTAMLDYYQAIPALTDVNTTNWLLTAHPDLYLYGTLLGASVFLVEDERLRLWKTAHDEALASLMVNAERKQYAGAPLAPRIGMRW